MRRFIGGSKNYHHLKVLMTVKDVFDIYSCNWTKRNLRFLLVTKSQILLMLLWFINWRKCWFSVRFSEITCNFSSSSIFLQVHIVLSVIHRLLATCLCMMPPWPLALIDFTVPQPLSAWDTRPALSSHLIFPVLAPPWPGHQSTLHGVR